MQKKNIYEKKICLLNIFFLFISFGLLTYVWSVCFSNTFIIKHKKIVFSLSISTLFSSNKYLVHGCTRRRVSILRVSFSPFPNQYDAVGDASTAKCRSLSPPQLGLHILLCAGNPSRRLLNHTLFLSPRSTTMRQNNTKKKRVFHPQQDPFFSYTPFPR